MPGFPPFTLRETIGTKLRRLLRQAEVSNPLINPPWIVPPAWAPSTVYAQGYMVSNGGSWFVCATAGTSAGSGGPSVTTDGDAHADGTAAWTYFSGPTIGASDAMAPTFASTTSNPGGNAYTAQGQPNAFRVYGGYAANGAGTQWAPKTFNQSSGTAVAVGPRISFLSDAAKVYIILGSSSPAVRFVIDNFDGKGPRYYSPSAFKAGAGTTWASFDFGSVGGKRVRRYWIEGFKNGDLNFGGVNVTTLDQVWAPPADDDVRVALITDSMGAGSSYGPMLPGANFGNRLGKLLGWNDVWSFATGSTGYIATASGTAYTYGERIAEAQTRTPDLWVPFGSTNDIGQTSADITAAALATYRSIRSGGSTAPIIVAGVWPISAAAATVETAVQAAVTQFADPKTWFVPACGAIPLPWVTGAWNNSANTNSVNAPMYIADGTHGADISTAYMAERAAREIRHSVLPYIK